MENSIEETMMVNYIMVDHTKVVNQSGTKGSKQSERAALLKIARLHFTNSIINPTLPIPILKEERFLTRELKIYIMTNSDSYKL